jgi:nucleotide-binding universal stress UspA family protein
VNLTVLSTHGRRGLDQFFIGSVAERILRRTPIPVLVVPTDGKSLLPEDEEAPKA